MPILWNDRVLTGEEISKSIEIHIPEGRNKLVTFSFLNAQPFRAMGRAKMLQKMGSEKQIPAFNRTTIDTLGGSGIMRYYESVNDVPARNGGFTKNYNPNFITFYAHNRTFDCKQNPDLFFFLLFHSKNVMNEKKSGEVPEFQFVKSTDATKATVTSLRLKATAFAKLEEIKEKNKGQLRAFYETLGHTDYDDKKETKDWDGILAPLYQFCEKDPQAALEKMNDAGLDIISKVVQAAEAQIIKQDGKSVYWGDHIKVELKKRKITDIPKGKASNWMEWFATNFLRSEVDVAQDIHTELEMHRMKMQ